MVWHAKNEDEAGDGRGVNLFVFDGSLSAWGGPPYGAAPARQKMMALVFLAVMVVVLVVVMVFLDSSDPDKRAPKEPPTPRTTETTHKQEERGVALSRLEPLAEEKRSSPGRKSEPEPPTPTTSSPELATTSELPTSEHAEPTTSTTTETTPSTPPEENEPPNLLAALGSILLGELEPDATELPETSTTPEADTTDNGDQLEPPDVPLPLTAGSTPTSGG